MSKTGIKVSPVLDVKKTKLGTRQGRSKLKGLCYIFSHELHGFCFVNYVIHEISLDALKTSIVRASNLFISVIL